MALAVHEGIALCWRPLHTVVQPKGGHLHLEGPGQPGHQVGVLQEVAQDEGPGVATDEILFWLDGGEQNSEACG